jgi:hypothetical protein
VSGNINQINHFLLTYYYLGRCGWLFWECFSANRLINPSSDHDTAAVMEKDVPRNLNTTKCIDYFVQNKCLSRF